MATFRPPEPSGLIPAAPLRAGSLPGLGGGPRRRSVQSLRSDRLAGRGRRTGNAVYGVNSYRGFESLSLRQIPLPQARLTGGNSLTGPPQLLLSGRCRGRTGIQPSGQPRSPGSPSRPGDSRATSCPVICLPRVSSLRGPEFHFSARRASSSPRPCPMPLHHLHGAQGGGEGGRLPTTTRLVTTE